MARRAFAVSTCAMLVACAEPATSVTALRLTAPVGATEVVPIPDEQLALAWTATATGPATIELILAPDRAGDPAVALATADLADGAATWTVPQPAPRAGTYRVLATARADADVVATAQASAIVFLQGVEFRDAALTFAATDAERDVWITATLGQPIDVVLVATPEAATSPRYVLATTSIASDLAPIGRVFRWTGASVSGAVLPAGRYAVTVEVTPRIRPVGYTVGGLTVTWTP